MGALGEGRISHFFPIKKINKVTFQSISCFPCLKLSSWKRKWVCVPIFEVVASPCPISAHSLNTVCAHWNRNEWMNEWCPPLISLSQNNKEIITFLTEHVYLFNKYNTHYVPPHSVLAYLECTGHFLVCPSKSRIHLQFVLHFTLL